MACAGSLARRGSIAQRTSLAFPHSVCSRSFTRSDRVVFFGIYRALTRLPLLHHVRSLLKSPALKYARSLCAHHIVPTLSLAHLTSVAHHVSLAPRRSFCFQHVARSVSVRCFPALGASLVHLFSSSYAKLSRLWSFLWLVPRRSLNRVRFARRGSLARRRSFAIHRSLFGLLLACDHSLGLCGDHPLTAPPLLDRHHSLHVSPQLIVFHGISIPFARSNSSSS